MLEFMNEEKYLVLAAGGGGDIVSAVLLAYILEKYGYRAFAGTVVWERYVVDPEPGPAKLTDIVNSLEKGEGYLVVNGSSYMVRSGRKIKYQAARLSKCTGRKIVIFSIEDGVKGYVDGIRNFMSDNGFKGLIGIDVGGDILATGEEEGLWSPLMDSATLAALKHFPHSILAVHSPGADGELDSSYVLKRIAEIYKRKGGLGARGLTLEDALLLEKLLDCVITEASRIALLAFRGYYGEYPIRGGTRKVFITPINTVTFFMNAETVYDLSPLAKLADHTRSFQEIVDRMNNAGIYTEYNLEIDIKRFKARNSLDVLRIRNIGVREMRNRRRGMKTDQSTDL